MYNSDKCWRTNLVTLLAFQCSCNIHLSWSASVSLSIINACSAHPCTIPCTSPNTTAEAQQDTRSANQLGNEIWDYTTSSLRSLYNTPNSRCHSGLWTGACYGTLPSAYLSKHCTEINQWATHKGNNTSCVSVSIVFELNKPVKKVNLYN